MPKAKESIYIETSIISAYFDFKKQDLERKKIAREFWQKILPKYKAFISETVIAELKSAGAPKANKFLDLIISMERFNINTKVISLAKRYIKARIIRKTQFNDALHLAIAVLNKIDYIVSYNYQDIVNPNQRKKIIEFNKIHKLYLTQISTPNDFLIII